MRIVMYRGASVLVALALFYLWTLELSLATYLSLFLAFAGMVSAIEFCRAYFELTPTVERFRQLSQRGGWAVVFLLGAIVALVGDLAFRTHDAQFRMFAAVAWLGLCAGAMAYFAWCRYALRNHVERSNRWRDRSTDTRINGNRKRS